jgi:peptidyl-prolyl cis-trans isomerase C
MKIWKALILGIVAIAFIGGCGGSTKSGEVLVKINGDKITEGDLEFLGEINPRIQRQLERPDGRKKILDNLVEQDLLYQAAMKEGLNRNSLVKAKVDLYRRIIIAQALVDQKIDEAAKKFYDENQDQFKKLKMSQIEIKFATPEEMKKAKGKKKQHTEQEALKIANDVKAKIDGGMTFDEAAKEFSEDPMTRARGGNMGLISQDDPRLIARGYEPLLKKAFEMKVGEVAGPIKTTSGYYLIAVTQGAELEPFDQAKQSILFKVKAPARSKLMADLKKDAKIVYPDEEKKAEETAKGTKEQEKFKEAMKQIQEKKKAETAEAVKKPEEKAAAATPEKKTEKK